MTTASMPADLLATDAAYLALPLDGQVDRRRYHQVRAHTAAVERLWETVTTVDDWDTEILVWPILTSFAVAFDGAVRTLADTCGTDGGGPVELVWSGVRTAVERALPAADVADLDSRIARACALLSSLTAFDGGACASIHLDADRLQDLTIGTLKALDGTDVACEEYRSNLP